MLTLSDLVFLEESLEKSMGFAGLQFAKCTNQIYHAVYLKLKIKVWSIITSQITGITA